MNIDPKKLQIIKSVFLAPGFTTPILEKTEYLLPFKKAEFLLVSCEGLILNFGVWLGQYNDAAAIFLVGGYTLNCAKQWFLVPIKNVENPITEKTGDGFWQLVNSGATNAMVNFWRITD